MGMGHILLLGAVAGATIFLGLPVGRLQNLGTQARAGLSALATGILLFLLWDVLKGAEEPIAQALHARHWGTFSKLGALGFGGFTLGLMGLVYYSEWMKKRANRRSSTLVGPGAAATDEFDARRFFESLSPGKQLALLIAIGIGVHNFGEGLAIGQAAAASQMSLAVTLIIGFGPAQRDRGLRHLRPDESAKARVRAGGFLALARPDRRRADVLRHPARPGVVERVCDRDLLRRRGGLDPLRRAGALRGQPQVRAHRCSSCGSCSRA